MPVCDVIIVSTISRMLRTVTRLRSLLSQFEMFVGDREHASVASESCRIFPSDRSAHLRTQQRGSAEKSGLQDVKKTNFIQYWRRSGLKNLDKPIIFMKKNVRNHSYYRIYPVLAQIRINRGLLYSRIAL